MQKKIFLFMFFLASWARAEYRVHILQIQNEKNNSIKVVRSTLSARQYRHIFPLQSNEKISEIDSWKCFGNTSQFRIHCPKPLGKI